MAPPKLKKPGNEPFIIQTLVEKSYQNPAYFPVISHFRRVPKFGTLSASFFCTYFSGVPAGRTGHGMAPSIIENPGFKPFIKTTPVVSESKKRPESPAASQKEKGPRNGPFLTNFFQLLPGDDDDTLKTQGAYVVTLCQSARTVCSSLL